MQAAHVASGCRAMWLNNFNFRFRALLSHLQIQWLLQGHHQALTFSNFVRKQHTNIASQMELQADMEEGLPSSAGGWKPGLWVLLSTGMDLVGY